MTSILGNQEQRKTKINTERWKEHKRYYENLEREAKKENTYVLKSKTLEGKLLKYNTRGEPLISINVDPKTAVMVYSGSREFDTMMQIFQSAGWKWDKGTMEPVEIEYMSMYPDVTAGFVNQEDIKRKKFQLTSYNYFQNERFRIYTMDQFCSSQRISKEMLEELGEWYDANIPNRRSIEYDLPF